MHAQEWMHALTSAVLCAVARPEVLVVLVVQLEAICQTALGLGPVACLKLGLGQGALCQPVLHLCLPAAGLLPGSPDLDPQAGLPAEGLLATQLPYRARLMACNGTIGF